MIENVYIIGRNIFTKAFTMAAKCGKMGKKGRWLIITTSEKLEIALKRQGFTKKELAQRLNTSQQNISKKFKFNDWRESDIKEICKAIGIDVEIILKFEDGSIL